MPTCPKCQSQFEITPEDLLFYDKISPIFNGQKYQIPEPTLCPECRQQRRLCWRNERKLYRNKCGNCGTMVATLYHPESPYKVYCQKCWWGDSWDPMSYGRDFDPNRSFLEQFYELQLSVPRMQMYNSPNSVNSEYTNHSADNKNCYMGVAFGECEDCMYGHWLVHCKNSVDGLYLEKCEQCYECSYCLNCHGVFYSQHCQNTIDSILCYECRDCINCIGCTHQQHKKYNILNQPVSKDEFIRVKDELLSSPDKLREFMKSFAELKMQKPHRFSNQINCYDCVGNDLYNCKNANICFNCRELEDCKYMFDLGNNKDSMDCYEHGWLVPSELNYEAHAGGSGYHLISCSLVSYSNDLLYCDICLYCSFCFGCVGLHAKTEYCILNKKYQKDEYEKLCAQIIEQMRKETGGGWGEFFPSWTSPFGYNETAAPEYFPLDKETALKDGFKWCDYESPFPKVDKVIVTDKHNVLNDVKKIPDEILDWAIECEVTKKPFRIIKQELKFYRDNHLPIPRRHPDQRHLDRMNLRPQRKLYNRKCDNADCNNIFMTVYPPNSSEKIYCEKCYLETVY
ncbi:MAG: hypothetical protein NTZ80_04515 [Patescibacteria group bacterium]|nr:hypothetical protein [Patescibacteria group bacterium]